MDPNNENLAVATLFKDVLMLFRQNMHRSFESTGITAPQGMVIGILHKTGKIKISELSSKLGLSNSTTSGILDRLEKQNMVERERSLEDKRVVYVRLSTRFEEMHQDFHERPGMRFEHLFEKVTKEDRVKIVDGLSVLKRLLSEEKNS